MEIYKFGGASVKDANGVRNLYNIVSAHKGALVVVVSAMGKTTNVLEELHKTYLSKKNYSSIVNELIRFHDQIISELLADRQMPYLKLYDWFVELLGMELKKDPALNPDFDYDRIVSFGELFSTAIVSAYFHQKNCFHQWLDARKLIRTSNDYREGKVEWELTKELITYNVQPSNCQLYITQGFLGSTDTNQVVTLGREGSDYSAAIFANALRARKMTIWKDVPGVMNADPTWYDKAQLIEEMSYKEAVEMSFFGANVIHPKTLKPLENLRIPLCVRSFVELDKAGTLIQKNQKDHTKLPVLIKKTGQSLLTISPKDFSFMEEENLTQIFSVFEKYRIGVNIMEKSALSFTACVSCREGDFEAVQSYLRNKFIIKYNHGLELLTVRHYTEALLGRIEEGREVLVEHRNRDSAWLVLKK